MRLLAVLMAAGLAVTACGGSDDELSTGDQAICDMVRRSRAEAADPAAASASATAAVAVAAERAENTELRAAATALRSKAQSGQVAANDPDMATIRRICGLSER